MAKTGEECWHQKPLRTKLDEAYDTQFDPDIAHNCDALRELVIPAQRCGMACPRYKPFGRSAISQQPAISGSRPQSASATPQSPAAPPNVRSVLRYIDHCLMQVCEEIQRNADYLRGQVQIRERQWMESDVWLSRPEAQSDSLGHRLADADQRYSQLVNERKTIQRRLRDIKSGRSRDQNFEELWLRMDDIGEDEEQARRARAKSEELMARRARNEAELEALYMKWQDAVERTPLLDKLCGELERCVGAWIANPHNRLRDSNVDRVLRLLKNITRYAEDDVLVATLKKQVDALSRYTLPV